MNRIGHPAGLPIDPRVGRTQPVDNAARGQQSVSRSGKSTFGRIFQQELGRKQGLRFSAHAQNRLDARGIDLTPEAVDRLVQAVDRAAAKGARDALLLMPGASGREDLALVVSVTNRTVVTAVDGANIRENVFTNIDSAVIVGREEGGTGIIS